MVLQLNKVCFRLFKFVWCAVFLPKCITDNNCSPWLGLKAPMIERLLMYVRG